MNSYKRNKGIKVSYKGTKSLMIHPPRCNYYSVIFHIFHMVVHSGEIIIIHHFLKSKIKRQSGSHYQWCSSHATNYSSLYSFGTFESSWHCQTQYIFTSLRLFKCWQTFKLESLLSVQVAWLWLSKCILQPSGKYFFSTYVGKFCLTIVGRYIWNDIPHPIREKPTKQMF